MYHNWKVPCNEKRGLQRVVTMHCTIETKD